MKAQKKFTLDDVTPGGGSYKKYLPTNLDQLQWFNDSILFVRDTSIISLNPLTQKETEICSLSRINDYLKQVKLPSRISIPSSFQGQSAHEIFFKTDKAMLLYDVRKDEFSSFEWKKNMLNPDFCASNGYFAYTKKKDLYLVSFKDKPVKINTHSEKDVVYGQAVHRNEWGIQKGTFWSPKGNFLAFYRMDESMVSDYTLIDNSKKHPEKTNIKYPAAGEKRHLVTIGIYSIKTGETVYLKTGEPKERFFTNLCWSPDEKELYVAEVNRRQDSCQLKAYNIKTGEARLLFVETHATYVEPENPPLFLDSTKFIWQSERSGHNHLYLYNTNGELIKTLTDGNWDVLQVLGCNAGGDKIFFASTEKSPVERHIYSLNPATGEKVLLTKDLGQHMGSLSSKGNYVVDNYSSITNPRKIDIIDTKTANAVNILTAQNPYEAFDMPEVRYGTIKAADDSTELYYRLTLPVPFDATKKYPVIVHVYGGPHVQLVQDSWLGGSKGWELYMAQQGFVMFTVDGRGSMNRGQAFEEAVYKNIGKAPMEDQLKGVTFLKMLPFVDSTRIGVYGWSFGGFMSTQLMCKAPSVFKAGVAGGSVIDWRLYEIMYGERYMQTPELNPRGYEENDLTNFAKNLQGRFMMIHCELDPVVRIVNTERFLDAAKASGKEVEFVRYQKHEHNVQGKDRVGLFEKISEFFIRNLSQ